MALSKAYVVEAAGAGALVITLAAGPILLPAAAHVAGFGASGVVAGSWAAALMRSYGGAVPGGSICALLQRVGMKGVSTQSTALMEAATAVLAAAFYTGFRYVFIKKKGLSSYEKLQPQLALLADDGPECCGNLIDMGDEEEELCNAEPVLRQPFLEENCSPEGSDGLSPGGMLPIAPSQLQVQVDTLDILGLQEDGLEFVEASLMCVAAEHGAVSENSHVYQNAVMSKAQASSQEACQLDLLL